MHVSSPEGRYAHGPWCRCVLHDVPPAGTPSPDSGTPGVSERSMTLDGHRFDAIARALASATTRRRVIRRLLGGGVGAIVAARIADALPSMAAQPTEPATEPATA